MFATWLPESSSRQHSISTQNKRLTIWDLKPLHIKLCHDLVLAGDPRTHTTHEHSTSHPNPSHFMSQSEPIIETIHLPRCCTESDNLSKVRTGNRIQLAAAGRPAILFVIEWMFQIVLCLLQAIVKWKGMWKLDCPQLFSKLNFKLPCIHVTASKLRPPSSKTISGSKSRVPRLCKLPNWF